MKRTKALLFLTLALCAALLTGCRSNVPNTTDGRVDEDSRAESESGMTDASEGATDATNARSRR